MSNVYCHHCKHIDRLSARYTLGVAHYCKSRPKLVVTPIRPYMRQAECEVKNGNNCCPEYEFRPRQWWEFWK